MMILFRQNNTIQYYFIKKTVKQAYFYAAPSKLK